MDKMANANSQFALNLFQKLKEAHPTGNLFFSPFSLSSALAMIVLGTRGNTASELLKKLHFEGVEDFHSVFHPLNTKINQSNVPHILKLANRLYGEKTFNFFPDFLTGTKNTYEAELCTVNFSITPDKAKKKINQWVEQQIEGLTFSMQTLHLDGVEDFHSVFHTLNTKINRSNAPYILKLANRLYGEKAFNFLFDFLTSTQNLYGAELSTVDFSNAPGKGKQEINQWVEQQTEGKICELLPEGSINEMTKLILVNAVYFKGNWAEAFKEKDTKDVPFRLNKKEKKNVKMMFMREKLPFGYIPECKCRVLELPYKGKDLSMIILLPDNIEDNSTGLEQLEQQLTLEKLQEWTQSKNMNSRWDVCVHLPTFRLEENYDLQSYFAALGLLDVFDSGKV